MADKEYFSHDYRSREDPKLKKLFMDKRLAGVGLYWCLVEKLYEAGGYIQLSELTTIAFDFRTNKQFVESVIKNYDLFKFDEVKFWSESALKRLNIRKEKSEMAQKKAQKRWENSGKKYNGNATAMQRQCKGNAKQCKEERGKKKDKYIYSPSGEDITRAGAEDLPPPEIPIKDILNLYQQLCPDLADKETKLPDNGYKNAQALNTAIEEGFTLQEAETLFKKANAAEWLKQADNITLAWILEKRQNIMAGAYDKIFGKECKSVLDPLMRAAERFLEEP